ncbi:unnamed protein product [Vitrella brassicaformis CCMP3155]|uniref:Uncharacterized protein n=2 Tax=Vitrella brassicaformis TaxID=1169539 RepID=A0A0G4ECP2_VITBC|nr:unnamed protein product [Vitrella brassicaformis CCMP3155]|eukprot:CEL93312.1 unnamed protein product [Vitrella brassicaformis CCMP3155]
MYSSYSQPFTYGPAYVTYEHAQRPQPFSPLRPVSPSVQYLPMPMGQQVVTTTELRGPPLVAKYTFGPPAPRSRSASPVRQLPGTEGPQYGSTVATPVQTSAQGGYSIPSLIPSEPSAKTPPSMAPPSFDLRPPTAATRSPPQGPPRRSGPPRVDPSSGGGQTTLPLPACLDRHLREELRLPEGIVRRVMARCLPSGPPDLQRVKAVCLLHRSLAMAWERRLRRALIRLFETTVHGVARRVRHDMLWGAFHKWTSRTSAPRHGTRGGWRAKAPSPDELELRSSRVLPEERAHQLHMMKKAHVRLNQFADSLPSRSSSVHALMNRLNSILQTHFQRDAADGGGVGLSGAEQAVACHLNAFIAPFRRNLLRAWSNWLIYVDIQRTRVTMTMRVHEALEQPPTLTEAEKRLIQRPQRPPPAPHAHAYPLPTRTYARAPTTDSSDSFILGCVHTDQPRLPHDLIVRRGRAKGKGDTTWSGLDEPSYRKKLREAMCRGGGRCQAGGAPREPPIQTETQTDRWSKGTHYYYPGGGTVRPWEMECGYGPSLTTLSSHRNIHSPPPPPPLSVRHLPPPLSLRQEEETRATPKRDEGSGPVVPPLPLGSPARRGEAPPLILVQSPRIRAVSSLEMSTDREPEEATERQLPTTQDFTVSASRSMAVTVSVPRYLFRSESDHASDVQPRRHLDVAAMDRHGGAVKSLPSTPSRVKGRLNK